MDDLISRQAAIDAVDFGITFAKVIDKSTGDVKELFQKENRSLTEAIERIKNLPSAQPEIIRCRECKYNNMPPTAGNAGCTLLYGMTNQNGFCSLAERREDKA